MFINLILIAIWVWVSVFIVPIPFWEIYRHQSFFNWDGIGYVILVGSFLLTSRFIWCGHWPYWIK